MTKKPQISERAYHQALNDDSGWCVKCLDFTTDMCEPDAREYECASCGELTVYGAEEALVMELFDFSEVV